jgi:hypothetical protein
MDEQTAVVFEMELKKPRFECKQTTALYKKLGTLFVHPVECHIHRLANRTSCIAEPPI